MVIILLCTCIKLSNYTSFKKIRLYNLEKKKNLSLNLRLKAGRQNLISLNCKFLINKTWTIKPVFIANINKEGSKDQVLHIINFFFCSPSPRSWDRLTSLSYNFLICKNKMIEASSSQGCSSDQITHPQIQQLLATVSSQPVLKMMVVMLRILTVQCGCLQLYVTENPNGSDFTCKEMLLLT